MEQKMTKFAFLLFCAIHFKHFQFLDEGCLQSDTQWKQLFEILSKFNIVISIVLIAAYHLRLNQFNVNGFTSKGDQPN